MTRTLAITRSLSVCLVLGACGTEQRVDVIPYAVSMHELTLAPGCYFGGAVYDPNTSSMMNATRQMNAMGADLELQYAIQKADLLLRPIREDPTASQWDVGDPTGAQIHGRILAQGSEWGSLTMVLLAEETGQSWRADIDYDPIRTVIDFGEGQRLVQTADAISLPTIARGCDPETELSFRRMRDGTVECWDATGKLLTPESSSGASLSGMSGSLACQDAARRALGR